MSAVKFKSVKKRQIRRRNSSDEEKSIDDVEEELEHSAKLSETLELQKLRMKVHMRIKKMIGAQAVEKSLQGYCSTSK